MFPKLALSRPAVKSLRPIRPNSFPVSAASMIERGVGAVHLNWIPTSFILLNRAIFRSRGVRHSTIQDTASGPASYAFTPGILLTMLQHGSFCHGVIATDRYSKVERFSECLPLVCCHGIECRTEPCFRGEQSSDKERSRSFRRGSEYKKISFFHRIHRRYHNLFFKAMERSERWFNVFERNSQDDDISAINCLLVGISAHRTGKAQFCDRRITDLTRLNCLLLLTGTDNHIVVGREAHRDTLPYIPRSANNADLHLFHQRQEHRFE